MAISVSITGVEGINKTLENYDKFLTKELSQEINASAQKIRSDAIKLAPYNMSLLRNSIQVDGESGGLTFDVAAKIRYAPYVEFGTGGKVSIPVGYEEYAALFKGKREVVGMRAQPYLIPSFQVEIPKLFTRLKNIINAKS